MDYMLLKDQFSKSFKRRKEATMDILNKIAKYQEREKIYCGKVHLLIT